MTVAVVIPCYNEESYVGKILGDLTHQNIKPDEVFVVDCHSKDKTVEVAKKFQNRLPLQILYSPYRSAASARNTGANASTTDYLLFLDADMTIKPNFIQKITYKAANKNVDFVSPRLKIEGHHPIDIITVWCINLWGFVYQGSFKKRAAGVGGAMLIKRSTHQLIGGYDPRLREFDDINYIRRMWKHNVTFSNAWFIPACTSNRRQKEQGRLVSIVQGMPSNYWVVSKVVRPLMNKLGINPKWHDIE